jgi:hypothetical protein
MCAFALVTHKDWKFGYPRHLWVWVIIKSVAIGFPIQLPPWVMLTPSLSRNAPAISYLTMSMAAGGNPLSLWSKGVGSCVSTCLVAQGLGFCGSLILSLGALSCMLNLSDILGAKKCSPDVFVGPCHDFEELWEVRGSLAEAGVNIAGNNLHHVLCTLCQTVRYDTRMVSMCTRTV